MVKRLLITALAALSLAPAAYAKSGTLSFAGGTRAEQTQVKTALDASSFDFSIVPTAVTVHIAKGVASSSTPGNVYLDANLLDAGRASWGVVQHEFGHQVDFSLFDDADRAQLQAALGGTAWCSGAPHAQLTCERFADLIAWAYWQSSDNVMKPASAQDEGGQMAPAAFRSLVAQLLPQAPVLLSSKLTVKPPRNR